MRSHAHILIDRSTEAVFDLSQDYALRHRWDTLTPAACLVQNAPQAWPGAIVRCPTIYGFRLDVAYVSWQRPSVAAFRMIRGPWWLHGAAGTWRFVPVGAQRCQAEFIYSVRLHPLL